MDDALPEGRTEAAAVQLIFGFLNVEHQERILVPLFITLRG